MPPHKIDELRLLRERLHHGNCIIHIEWPFVHQYYTVGSCRELPSLPFSLHDELFSLLTFINNEHVAETIETHQHTISTVYNITSIIMDHYHSRDSRYTSKPLATFLGE
jgi:hypothetical protein